MTNLVAQIRALKNNDPEAGEEARGWNSAIEAVLELLPVEPTKKPADLSYDEFWQKVRETGWNPAPNDLRALLILWESEGGSSQNDGEKHG